MALSDFTRCKDDCLSCPWQGALPGWCDGRCPSCPRARECPCCNRGVREHLQKNGGSPAVWAEEGDETKEVEASISQVVYPAPWQQRAVGPDLVKTMAADLGHRGQTTPIKVRPWRGANGRLVYQVINGEVRVRAARVLGWPSLKAVVRELDNCQAAIEYLLDNLAERKMPWEEVARGILAVEQEVARKNGERCDSRLLGRLLGRSKDWVNDHKHALRLAQAHGIPEGAIPHYKLLRPLRRGLPFHIEEEIIRGIIGQKWTVHRVLTEVNERWDRVPDKRPGKSTMIQAAKNGGWPSISANTQTWRMRTSTSKLRSAQYREPVLKAEAGNTAFR